MDTMQHRPRQRPILARNKVRRYRRSCFIPSEKSRRTQRVHRARQSWLTFWKFLSFWRWFDFIDIDCFFPSSSVTVKSKILFSVRLANWSNELLNLPSFWLAFFLQWMTDILANQHSTERRHDWIIDLVSYADFFLFAVWLCDHLIEAVWDRTIIPSQNRLVQHFNHHKNDRCLDDGSGTNWTQSSVNLISFEQIWAVIIV